MRALAVPLIAASLCAVALCAAPAQAKAPPRAPALEIVAPAARAQVAGPITLRTRLSRPAGRHAVRFFVDGRRLATLRPAGATASRRLDTRALRNGWHTLRAEARVALAGRTRTVSATRSFKVVNRAGGRPPGQVAPLGAAAPPDHEPPAAPGGLAYDDVQPEAVTLRWAPAPDNVGVTAYEILRDGAPTGSTAAQSFPVAGLECEYGYELQVVAVDAAGNRSASAPLHVETGRCVTPSGVPMPIHDRPNYRLIFKENFNRAAARGTMGSDTDPHKVVYTGSRGTNWVTYPRNYLDTYDRRPYRSDEVLSVHDGVLDFWLHPVDGRPAGANPSPLLPGGGQYLTYGRWSARMKVEDTDLSEYYVAWLLWPNQESDWESAESDFPEGPLLPGKNGVLGTYHFGPNKQQVVFGDASVDIHDWHTYSQEWAPGVRRYFVDGELIYETSGPVYDKPQRWQLQVETKGEGAHSGHVLVDWAAIWEYVP